MHERLKQIRETLGYNQTEFANLLGFGRSTLGMLEVGKREILERHIKTVCSIFNVNEEWLRDGTGEMFVKSETFSLDEYAKKKNLTPLEFDIIKSYIELDEDVRKNLISNFKAIFDKHSDMVAAKEEMTATKEETPDTPDVKEQTIEDDSIERELQAYRLELEAEKKGRISSALDDTKEKLG